MKTCLHCHMEYKGKSKSKFCSSRCFGFYNAEASRKRWQGENNPRYCGGKVKCSVCKKDMSYGVGNNRLKHVKKRVCRACQSIGKAVIGPDHYNYKNYLEVRAIKHANDAWSKRIKIRDEQKCIVCGSNKNLEAHHILPRKTYPQKALETENGATLCRECHWLVYKNWIGISYPYQTGGVS